MTCAHTSIQCLNHYELIRKYRCPDCGAVLMCACEEALARTFLPHQISEGCELESQARVPVDGFSRGICAECRGEPESPHPRAAIWGQKGKVERFYWREITKTYYELLLDHYGGTFPFPSIVEHDLAHPALARTLVRKARSIWQARHKANPKYDLHERTQAEFFEAVAVPVREVAAPYRKIDRGEQEIGRWELPDGTLGSAEDAVASAYRAEGFTVLRCERKLISVWVATFLGISILDPSDPNARLVMRNSTRGWSPKSRNTPRITFSLPRDFGTPGYWQRCSDTLETWFAGMRIAADIVGFFDMLLPETELLRDYLRVADDDAVRLGREALSSIPRELLITAIKWTIGNFWARQPGWPDLLVLKDGSYRFVEVKSPHDRLSQEQMSWFEWAVNDAGVSCELVRLKRG